MLMTNLLYKTGNMNGLINRLRDSIQELPRFLNDGMDLPSNAEALSLAEFDDTAQLIYLASKIRDKGYRNNVTYSRKVFIPLTHLCRDVCHYCTFAKTPKRIEKAFLSLDDVLAEVKRAEKMGCKEALFTLGERPELRYKAARDALADLKCGTTLEYLAKVAAAVCEETTVLPHINAGCMSGDEIALLRPVSASMGIMLESSSKRLCEKGMPHFGSPDKDPLRRLETMKLAGQAAVPFTTGILIGIGETRIERIESLLAIRRVHHQYGNIQEIIVQNFRAKPGTKMAQAPEPDLDDLLWTIAVARIIFGHQMSIQAPPNLSPGVLPLLVSAGINDWGGVSPVTPDYVNPEAPWPHLEKLASETEAAGKYLQERLTIYPAFLQNQHQWLDSSIEKKVLCMVDSEGFPRTDNWVPGIDGQVPPVIIDRGTKSLREDLIAQDISSIVSKARHGGLLSESDIIRLFQARGPEVSYVCQAANKMRKDIAGESVTYVVTRNINYTNICYFKCQFCAFSKGKLSENLRGRPYDLDSEEITRRTREAWSRGATEVCLQGGIHPNYTGQKYLDVLSAVKTGAPDIHIHAFSPLEVWQGASTLGVTVREFLKQLKAAGLGSLPGTAAEILDDEVRAVLCPDKINTSQWLEVIETAHNLGLKTTATIMFGHVDRPVNWARHLIRIRDLQIKTGGFTELVPLPFVPLEAPIYLKGNSRKGPTFRESILMHAVARLALNEHITNIQTSWVKLGEEGTKMCLTAGANDLGGTLMNETITRSAGATHGEEKTPRTLEDIIHRAGRTARQRTTLYKDAPVEQTINSFNPAKLVRIVNSQVKRKRSKKQGAIYTPKIDSLGIYAQTTFINSMF